MLTIVLIATIAAFIAGIFAGDYLARGKRELFDQSSGDGSDVDSLSHIGTGQ